MYSRACRVIVIENILIRFPIVRPPDGSLTIDRLLRKKFGSSPFANGSNRTKGSKGTNGSAHLCLYINTSAWAGTRKHRWKCPSTCMFIYKYLCLGWNKEDGGQAEGAGGRAAVGDYVRAQQICT
jgi:hypothetical protein